MLRSPTYGSALPGLPAVFLAALWLSACGGTNPLDSVDAGRTFSYEPGVPNFDLEAIATWRSERAGIDVYASIPYRSLSYIQGGGKFNGRFELIFQLRDPSGERVLWEATESLTRVVSTYDSTQLYTSFIINRRIEVGTGKYVVRASVEDRNGGGTAFRAQRIDVVDWNSDLAALSRIRLEARDQGMPYEPVLAPHLSDGLDSLRAVIELYNAPERVELNMRLLRPRADLDPAEPPYWFQVREQRYTYEGLDYRRSDTLQVTRRALRDAPREISVIFNLPELEEGVYRIEVSAEMGETSPPFRERRDFTVKGADYPRVTTLDEMVEALVYIARDREMRPMQSATTVEEKRAAFESFWLDLGGNPRRAADLIKRYYSRVEEANLLFTSHKRGWKTDQGMVFVIMGPPVYVDQRYGEGRRLSIWRYPPPKSMNAQMGYYPVDPNRSPVSQMETRFIFEEARKLDQDIPYPQYILRRNRVYQRIWEDAVLLWRSGSVL